MKMKTCELTGTALDWAVCKAEGDELAARNIEYPKQAKHFPTISPSTNWSLAGPIIEREQMEVMPALPLWSGGAFAWEVRKFISDCGMFVAYGPTPLVAAMRCFVVASIGDEVEIPDELVPPSHTK